jgi:hypothetical protein
MLQIKKQIFNSVLISADSKRELAETMMRFQEYYESPFWQGKIFTRGQFLNWYSKKYGGNTYHRDWSGFNFPSYILEPFKKGLFDPLTKNEKEILNFFKYRDDKFYIIGANNESVLKHELCHALYYTNESYRSNIDKLLNNNKDKIKPASLHLLKLGYSKNVLFDEIQAYTLDGDGFIPINENIKLNIQNFYKKYSKKHIDNR